MSTYVAENAAETEHSKGATEQKAGIQAALLAVCLTLAAIASLRTHAQGIVLSTQAVDKWQFFQSRRLRYHNLEMGADLIAVLGAKTEAAETMMRKYESQKDIYQKESAEAQKEARRMENLAAQVEDRARRYDFSEGLLEIGLVLTSLFYISKKKLFTTIGAVAGAAGIALAISGLML